VDPDLKSAILAIFQKSADWLDVQPSISVHRKKISKILKAPSVELACLLGIQNEIQAHQMFFLDNFDGVGMGKFRWCRGRVQVF
jgi:hypothetical protein